MDELLGRIPCGALVCVGGFFSMYALFGGDYQFAGDCAFHWLCIGRGINSNIMCLAVLRLPLARI